MSRIDDPTRQQSQQAGGAAQSLRDMGRQVKETAHEKLQNLRETASEYYEQGREKAMEWEQNFENYVREQPIKSVLIAAGVGLVLGFVWRRM